MRLLVIVVVGTIAVTVLSEFASTAVLFAVAALALVVAGAVHHRRRKIAAERLATARREAVARLPALGRPTPLQREALQARFFGPAPTEELPSSRRAGARFFWALVVGRYAEVDVKEGREQRRWGGYVGFLDDEGRVRIEPAGDLAYRNEHYSYVVVLSGNGSISVHDRDPERTLEEIHPATTALLDHPLLWRRERDPTWTGWRFRCHEWEATVLPVPGSGWTTRWQGDRASADHYRLDTHPTLVAALRGVIAVAEGRVRPALHAPVFTELPLAADDPAPPAASTAPPAASSQEGGSSTKPASTKPASTKPASTKPASTKPASTKPASAKPGTAAPRSDWMRLDLGRIDDRSTVGFLSVFNGRHRGAVFRIFGEKMVIGRSPDCDISLPNGEGVSRKHALLEIDGDSCTIIDIGSCGGLWVNSVRVGRKILEEGDVIILGSSNFVRFTRDVVGPAADGGSRAPS